MAIFNYQEFQKENSKTKQENNKNKFSYFSLKKDGEEAIVRFMYNNPSEFSLATVHTLKIDNKIRKINCLHTPYSPVNNCPLCNSGDRAQRKFYIKLLHYVQQEDGTIKAIPKIWERSDKYTDTLNNYYKEYGNLSDTIFKVKRNGAENDTKTSYDIMLASPVIYKPEIYIKDEEAFKDFDFIKNGIITSKNEEELNNLINSFQQEQVPFPTGAPSTQSPYNTQTLNDENMRIKKTFTY